MSGGSVLRHLAQVGFTLSASEASCELCNVEDEQ
jgi:hypothetical protein